MNKSIVFRQWSSIGNKGVFTVRRHILDKIQLYSPSVRIYWTKTEYIRHPCQYIRQTKKEPVRLFLI